MQPAWAPPAQPRPPPPPFPTQQPPTELGGSPVQHIDDDAQASATLRPVRGKRKRLAKACDSCHKSKRRCDGTSPCANCDFAGKPCVYTDSAGRTVPPPHSRVDPDAPHHDTNHPHRSLTPTQPALSGPHLPPPSSWPSSTPDTQHHPSPAAVRGSLPPHSHSYPPHAYTSYSHDDYFDEGEVRARPRPRYASDHEDSWASGRGRSHSVAELTLDPSITRELVNLFFLRLQPCNMIIHRPTFLFELAQHKIPAFLLNSIFAVAAPYSQNPHLKTSPPWQAGERFAEVARQAMFDKNGQGKLVCKKDLECVQALCILQYHECVMRPEKQSDGYMRQAMRILVDLGVHNLDANVPTTDPDSRPGWITKECYRRAFWLVHLIELLSCAFTSRELSVQDRDLKLYMPMEEACFELAVASSSPPEFFRINPSTPSNAISELGHLVRVTSIYAKVVTNIAERSKESKPVLPPNDRNKQAMADWEKLLESWRISLPDRLRFTKENLSYQMSGFEACINNGAWAYAYMHALSECCVLGFHQSLQLDGDLEALRSSTLRQLEALENLVEILHALTPKGRRVIMMATLILAVVQNRKVISLETDPHVVSWFERFEKKWGPHISAWAHEYEESWGVSLEQICSVEFRQEWCKNLPQPPARTSPAAKEGTPSSRSGSGNSVTLPPPPLHVSHASSSSASSSRQGAPTPPLPHHHPPHLDGPGHHPSSSQQSHPHYRTASATYNHPSTPSMLRHPFEGSPDLPHLAPRRVSSESNIHHSNHSNSVISSSSNPSSTIAPPSSEFAGHSLPPLRSFGLLPNHPHPSTAPNGATGNTVPPPPHPYSTNYHNNPSQPSAPPPYPSPRAIPSPPTSTTSRTHPGENFVPQSSSSSSPERSGHPRTGLPAGMSWLADENR